MHPNHGLKDDSSDISSLARTFNARISKALDSRLIQSAAHPTIIITDLISIGGTIPKGAGIYLHILWREGEPNSYLYVGHSTETS